MTKEEIMEAIEGMTVLELSELVKAMEEKFGVSAAAPVAVAAAGAVAGAYAEKALKSQNAMEYVVALENGESKTVVQGLDPTLAVGQKVWLMVSYQGRSRVTARS